MGEEGSVKKLLFILYDSCLMLLKVEINLIDFKKLVWFEFNDFMIFFNYCFLYFFVWD